jgi:hypothetical protein
MTLQDLLSKGVLDFEVIAGESLSTSEGFLVTLGADGRAYRYDPSGDTNHMIAFCTNSAKQDQVVVIRPVGAAYGICVGGATAQDRMMPSSGGDIGKVERWSSGNVSVGFALSDAADGELVPILISHEINT